MLTRRILAAHVLGAIALPMLLGAGALVATATQRETALLIAGGAALLFGVIAYAMMEIAAAVAVDRYEAIINHKSWHVADGDAQ